MIDKILYNDSKILVAFSGGKDSIAMVLYLLSLGIKRSRIILHHHLVDGNEENLFDWPCTESYCIAFAKAFNLTLLFSYRKGGIAREIYRNNEPKQDIYFQIDQSGPYMIAPSNKKRTNTRLKFPALSPSLMIRWCSATVKIEVLRTSIVHNPDYNNTGSLFVLTGERREESANRAKYADVEVHATNTKSRKVITWRPIIDWSEQQVWRIIQHHNVQPHPAYMLGWSRCSCQLCIFSDPDLWATINKITPHKVEKIASIESEIGFTLYDKQTISEKVNRGKVLDGMNPYWIDQATNQFTTPIITDNWVLPAGAYKKQSAGSL
jgi:3'-phosphoadenosine 5'-phosphosulfate sulfotransferase (PAPS reductase)/FAD synthetase